MLNNWIGSEEVKYSIVQFNGMQRLTEKSKCLKKVKKGQEQISVCE